MEYTRVLRERIVKTMDIETWSIIESHPDAKIIGDKLFINNFHVKEYPARGLEGKIPSLYIVSVKDDKRGRWTFEGGLDLLENGKVWFKGITFDSMREVFSELNSLFNEWEIGLEEPRYEQDVVQ